MNAQHSGLGDCGGDVREAGGIWGKNQIRSEGCNQICPHVRMATWICE